MKAQDKQDRGNGVSMGLFGRKSNDGPRAEVKQVTIDTGSQEGAVELVKLQEEGWEIVSQQKRGAFEWKPGQTDFVLKRNRPN